MDLSKFHAASHSELEKYMSVDYYDGFSVAEYINQPDNKPLFAFTHKHDHYESFYQVLVAGANKVYQKTIKNY